MKKALALVALLTIVVTSVVMAAPQDLPGGGWWSGEQVQNVGGETAAVNVTAYDAASTATYTADSDLAAGASTTFLPSDFAGMEDGFQGSAIVSADQDIRAIVNVTNREISGLGLGVANGLAAGQYQGVNVAATTISFPLVKNNYYGKTTTFYIQNAGDGDADLMATFAMGDGNEYTLEITGVGKGQMAIINPADADGGSGTPSGNTTDAVGSLTVTSDQPLAGVVMEHGSEEPAQIVQSTRGFAPQDGDTKAYAPIIKSDFFNRFTGLQVQNVSGGPIDITVTYAGSGDCDGVVDEATNVADGASHTFVHLGTQTNLPAGCLASATVVATGEVVAIVNESYTPAAVQAGQRQESVTYSAIPDNAATTKISVPLFKEDSYNKGTGVQVQNVGDADATNVVLTFTGPAGSFTTSGQTIAAGGSMTFVDVRKKDAAFWSGDAMDPADLDCDAEGNNCGAEGVFGITITSDQPIVAIANESTYPFTAPRISQDKNNYEGFNLIP